MTNFVTPVIDWAALTPIIIVMGAAVLGVIIEAFAPRGSRRGIQVTLTLAALAGALVAVVWRWTEVDAAGAQTVVGGQLIEDPFTIIAQGIVLVGALLAAFVIADRTQSRGASGLPGGAGDDSQGHRTDRGIPSRHVRGDRHDGLPGRR